MSKIKHVDLYEKNQKIINTAQHPDQQSWDDNSERNHQTQTTVYETEAKPQKQHFLEQLVELSYEDTSGTFSLTDVQSSPHIREFSIFS